MTPQEDNQPTQKWTSGKRVFYALAGVALWLVGLLPPVALWAMQKEVAQGVQYCIFAFGVPVLLVAGGQWWRLGVASHPGAPDAAPRWLDRIAQSRNATHHQQRAAYVGVAFVVVATVWRLAPVVNATAPHWWGALLESVILVPLGVVLFVELIASYPLSPRASSIFRIGVCAGVMWSTWIVSYLGGMSTNAWYHVFKHVAGHGLSLSADQQLLAGSVWLLSGAVFVPIIFWNLMRWLQSEPDPKEELGRLIREERNRGFFGSD